MSAIVSEEYFLDSFARSVRDDTAAAFVGAGLSIGAGYPSWGELVQSIPDVPKDEDILRQAQFAILNESRAVWNDLIVDTFSRPRSPTASHNALANSGIRRFWTTNYDTLLEKAFAQRELLADVKFNNYHLGRAPYRERDVVLYKMHGDVSEPGNCVITKDDFQHYERERPGFLNVLLGELYARSFLFLGMSFRDPNVELVLSRVRMQMERSERPHFFVVVADEDEKQREYGARYLDRYNVKTVLINQHEGLLELLDRLRVHTARLSRVDGVFLSGAVDDGEPEAEANIALATLLTERLIADKFRIVSGYGSGVGEHIAEAALNAIAKDPHRRRLQQITFIPFPPGSIWGDKAREDHARRLMRHAGFAIFIAGFRGTKGVIAEFEVSQKEGLVPIPVGATGSQAQEVWKSIAPRLGQVYGLEDADFAAAFAGLNQPGTPEQLAERTIRFLKRFVNR